MIPNHSTDSTIDSMENQCLAPFAVSQGFRQRGRLHYVREADTDTVHHLMVDVRKTYSADERFLTVLVAVGFRSLAEFVVPILRYSSEGVKWPRQIQIDVGNLGDPPRLQRIRVFPGMTASELCEEVMPGLVERGVEFFSNYGTLDAAVRAWSRLDDPVAGHNADYHLVAHLWLSGDPLGALAFAEQRLTAAKQDLSLKQASVPRQRAVLRQERLVRFLQAELAGQQA